MVQSCKFSLDCEGNVEGENNGVMTDGRRKARALDQRRDETRRLRCKGNEAVVVDCGEERSGCSDAESTTAA